MTKNPTVSKIEHRVKATPPRKPAGPRNKLIVTKSHPKSEPSVLREGAAECATKPIRSSRKLLFVDLFAGAGGLSCGLEMAGFTPVFASELEPIYASTFQRNHRSTACSCKDIRELDPQDILDQSGLGKGELDLLAGGPPCQGFSINAPLRSTSDQRNHLFLEYLRVAEALYPKMLLIENVPGIVSFDKGGTVKAIYRAIESLGYKVEHKILFAGHYGIPQLRFRTFFIASRTGTLPNWPEPTHYTEARANFSGAAELCLPLIELMRPLMKPAPKVIDAISDLPDLTNRQTDPCSYKSEPKSEYQKLLRNGATTVHNHKSSNLSEINLERLKHIPQGGSWRDIPFDLLPEGMKKARRSDHTKRYGRLHPDGLCSTILTKCDPHWGCFFHPFEERVLSVREAARIQAFPDHYVFGGSIIQQYEQVGNAVPPLLAKAVGLEIKKALIANFD
jgi:DNA (cytosine-5)-methyltransferase 1